MKLWKVIIYGTIVWSLISGVALLYRNDPTSYSTTTWHKVLVGWAMIVSGLFVLFVRLTIAQRKRQPVHNTLLWIELGMVCGSASMRIPMAISQSLHNRIPWAQTISLSNYVIWSIFGTITMWAFIVIPGINGERRAYIARNNFSAG